MSRVITLPPRQRPWKNSRVLFSPPTPLTKKAFEFATHAHEGQKRHSGEPYITHAIAVTAILDSWGIKDEELLAAALLHDTLEDVAWVTRKMLEKDFGKNVTRLVEGVSKFKSHNGEVNHSKTHHKIIEKSYIDPRVAVLKLADRLHNLLTLQAIPPHKQPIKARETLDIYARLAESLGMWIVKRDLEDLSFMYIKPDLYKRIKKQVDADPRLHEAFITSWVGQISRLLKEAKYNSKVEIRINGYWALAKKRERAARLAKSLPDSFFDINDLVSFRVCMESELECYCFLGKLHKELGNIIDFSRFDEFMGANGRDNGYQALQTTLLTPSGAIEIAITTKENEGFNNWGVVSLMKKHEKKLEQYSLKLIFTPTNEVRFLPRAATGIDFAYAINPRLGADAKEITINGKKQPLSEVLPNAATVRVIAGKPRRAPHPEVLYFCLPSTAKIVQEQLKQERRDKLVIQGRKRLQEILTPLGIIEPEDLAKHLPRLLYWFGCRSVGDLCFKVGGGYLLPNTLTDWLREEHIYRYFKDVTTIKVVGHDQPGVLNDLASWVTALRGNITRLDSTSKRSVFSIKLVVEGLTQKSKSKLTQKLSSDTRFTSWKLV